MVDAGEAVQEAKDERLISVRASGPLPEWLSKTLNDAGVHFANADGVPDFELISMEQLNEDAPDEILPRVAWIENASEISVSTLIESGVRFAISRDTSPKGLLRSLTRLAKRPKRNGGNS